MSRQAEAGHQGTALEVGLLFLRLGAISFGGQAGHIAMMEQEVVNKRGWLTREHFLDLVGATNLIPGPNALEMVIHIGYVRAGWPGLLVAGIAFIVPAFAISLALAVAYVRYEALPAVAELFYGIAPVVVAIVIGATYRLGRTAIRDWRAAAIAAAVLAARALGVDEVIALLGAGMVALAVYGGIPRRPSSASLALLPAPLVAAPLAAVAGLADRVIDLGLYFLKVGALIFGGGMVLFAFVERDVVSGYGWLTYRQLLDAIAVGQMTPGPVLTSATFIGYLVAGIPGALAATVGVFAPSFAITAVVNPWVPRLRRANRAQAFLRGVNAAVVALMLAMSFMLARSAIRDPWCALIGLAALVALLRFRTDPLWLIVTGAAIGGLLHVVGLA